MPFRSRSLHLGYTPAELANSPYAPYYRPQLAPLPPHVQAALLTGPVAPELLPPLARAADLLQDGHQAVETGYALCPDGSGRVHVLTGMPGVTPAMWAWWFGWHGSDPMRYKLWHPRAHLHVGWADGRSDLSHHIGRVSRVVEYIGAQRLSLSIAFVAPRALGLDEALLQARGEVAICARVGFDHTLLDTGWVLHHLRPTADGCEMRSRFWAGGRHVSLRGLRVTDPLTRRVARWVQPIQAQQAADLLVHCAQEMQHLAAFLPELYARFGPSDALASA
ncbi:MAG: hypothetical protein RI907_373 [Pseudomonadota bacterium]|jgi:hypothetical protein